MSTPLSSSGSEPKQKVTFYLSSELHHSLKVRAAVEAEPMSALAERALQFYLDHAELVEGTLGSSHQVHQCPACAHPFIIRSGQVQSLPQATQAILEEDSLSPWDPPKTLITCS
ncbi:MAG: hypothetical protein Q6K99_04480 [Thermostichales cyanobacterium BF4_bins_65]